MSCDNWRTKLDAYVDAELAPAEAKSFSDHLRECASCAAEALGRVQMKWAVAVAGKRYEPSAELRARITKSVAAKPARKPAFQWRFALAPAALALLALLIVLWNGRENSRRERLYGELADLHVTALASATPVDVISTDRHTVKPWFQGKIPFSFNLPELQGSPFTLLGGRVTYLEQTPGTHLIYQVRKHEISVFIFQDRGEGLSGVPEGSLHTHSFNEECWTKNGLRYFVVGDVSAEEIRSLSKLLRDAG